MFSLSTIGNGPLKQENWCPWGRLQCIHGLGMEGLGGMPGCSNHFLKLRSIHLKSFLLLSLSIV